MKKSPPWGAVALAVSLFLAPLLGGMVSTERMGLLPSESLFLSIFSGGAATPLASHLVVALPALIVFIVLAVRRDVLQVPNPAVGFPVMLLAAMILFSLPMSEFRGAALPALAEWMVVILGMLAAIAAVGRREGPRIVLIALFAGSVMAAVRGIREFADAGDPTWRIFGGWVNPNALAAMLLVGLFVGLSLLVTQKDRLGVLLFGIGNALIGFALLLTQSKGAIACGLVGGVVFVALVLAWGGPQRRLAVGRLGVAVALIALLALGLNLRQRSATPGASGATALARFGSAEATREQSGTFRILLWRSSVQLVTAQPLGYGPGSFRFVSSQPGLVTQTQLAHNSFLQLAVENNPLSALALLVAGITWLRAMFRGARSLPLENNLLKAGIMAAVVAIGAHSLVDSDLHYFGLGFSVFALMGVALLLCADGVMPELLPKGLRAMSAAGATACLLLLAGTAHLENLRAVARGALSARDVAGAQAALNSLGSIAPRDGEAAALRANLSPDPKTRMAQLELAAASLPSTANLRRLAREQLAQGEATRAQATLGRALRLDPNNLSTLWLTLETYRTLNDATGVRNTARRLVAVEPTPYFQVRSLPELIPTETYRARLVLAPGLPPREQIDLLKPATEGFAEYARQTVPLIVRAVKAGIPEFGGQSLEDGIQAMSDGKDAATLLLAAQRSTGEEVGPTVERLGAFEATRSELTALAGGAR